MPTCTPVYGLPYAIGSDDPCDIAETFCDFANTVDTIMAAFRENVNRVVRIPMAKVSTQDAFSSTAIITDDTIPFDTEEIDTIDMVDLSADPYSVEIPFDGLYWAPTFVEYTRTGGVNMELRGYVNGFTAAAQGTGESTAGTGGITVATVVARTGPSGPHPDPIWRAGDKSQVNGTWQPGSAASRVSAEHTVYWFSDI